MMTEQELKESVAKVAELDAKRTQGEWVAEQDDRDDMQWNWTVEINHTTLTVCSLFHSDGPDWPNGGVAVPNAAFIAHAPQMASLIAQLWQERQSATIKTDNTQALYNALAVIEQQRAVMQKALEALETAKRFYAKKSKPPTPAYLLEAIDLLNGCLKVGE